MIIQYGPRNSTKTFWLVSSSTYQNNTINKDLKIDHKMPWATICHLFKKRFQEDAKRRFLRSQLREHQIIFTKRQTLSKKRSSRLSTQLPPMNQLEVVTLAKKSMTKMHMTMK